MIKRNTSIGNYSYNMLAAMWEAVTDVAVMAMVARFLDVSTFGDFAFVMAFVAAFKVLCGVALPVILTKEIAINQQKAPEILTAALVIQVVMSVLTLLIVAVIINLIHHSPAVIRGTYMATIGIILDFFGLLLVSVARGFERMEYSAYRIVISQTVFLALVLLLVRGSENGFLRIFLFFMVSHFVGLAYSVYAVFTRFTKPAAHLDKKLCRYMFMESYPIALRRFIRRIGFRVDTILLNFLRGNVEVGLFHGAYKITQGLMFVGEGLVVSVFPVLSRHFVSAKESLDLLYERSFRFLAVSGGLLGVILYSFSREFVILVLGKKYMDSGQVLKVFSSLIVFMFLTKLAERMLIVGRKQFTVTAITALALIINVVFDLLLIPRLGIIGASLATVSAEAVLFVLGLYYTHKHVSKVPVHVCTVKVLAVFSMTCIIVSLAQTYGGRLLGFVVGPLVYVLGIVILGLTPVAEINLIKKKVAKAVRLQPEHP